MKGPKALLSLFKTMTIYEGPEGAAIIVKTMTIYEGPEGAVVTLSGPRISGMLPIYSLMACHSITPLGQIQAIHFFTSFVHIL